MRVGMRRFDVRFSDELNLGKRQARPPFRTWRFILCTDVSPRFRWFFYGVAHRAGLLGPSVSSALLLRGFPDW